MALGKPFGQLNVRKRDENQKESFADISVTQTFGTVSGEKHGASDRLENVKGGNREEKIKKHEDGFQPFLTADGNDVLDETG